MGACILNHEQEEQWRKTGQRPDCRHHRHTNTYKQAMDMIERDEAYYVHIPNVINSRSIVVYTCVVRYVWQGRKSAGFTAMQLCDIIGRKKRVDANSNS